MHLDRRQQIAETASRWWEVDLPTALIPLYAVSKACCLNAYTYRPLLDRTAEDEAKCEPPHQTELGLKDAFVNKPRGEPARWPPSAWPDRAMLDFSAIGVLHAVGSAAGYSAYHVVSSLRQSSKLTDPNLVRVAIDLKNQYVGCALVLVLVGVSLLRQPTVDLLQRTLLRVDRQLATIRAELPEALPSPAISNTVWLRNMLLMLVLGVGVKAALEVSNCLMYIRDSGSPFSSYCLALCIVPQTLCVVCELQFVAYALLLRDRFGQLNRWLRQLQPRLVRGDGPAFRALGRIATAHGELAKAISLLNRSHGVQNATLLLYQFVTLVELGYNTCMMSVRFSEDNAHEDDSIEDLVETVAWIGWFVLEIFVLCYFGHVTVVEARLTANLLSLPTAYSLSQRAHFRTVSQEHMTFLNKNIRITCGGLFSVDLTLLYAIIGATTTYLIILVQFDHAFNGE